MKRSILSLLVVAVMLLNIFVSADAEEISGELDSIKESVQTVPQSSPMVLAEYTEPIVISDSNITEATIDSDIQPTTNPAETSGVTQPTSPSTSTQPTTPSTSTEPTTPSTPQIPTALEIDTEHVYQGMDMAYEDGYSPRVSEGYAYIVLPLLSNGRINDEKITVSLGLGSSASSPFVITNYEKIFSLETVMPLNSTVAQELFLVHFDVQLSTDRVNGVYPVTVNISGYDATGQSIDCIYTLYVTITDGKSGEVSVATPEVATAEPVVYIANTVVEPETVTAGEEFQLTVTLKNSLTTKSVRNMLVTVDTGNLQINLLEDSNVFPVEKIAAGGETELILHFNSDASIPAGKYNLNFSFKYDSSKTLNLSAAGSTIVDIRQPANMELVMPRFPESVTVGETVPLSLQVMNMGRDSMYNVRCIVSGFGLAPSNTGYIGTMSAGSSAMTEVELYIIALNATEGNENGNQYGNTTGTVTLIYEDDTGSEFQQSVTFETEVQRPVVEIPQTQDTQEEIERASLGWWVVILVLGGLIVAAYIGFVAFRKRKKRGLFDR